MRDARRSTSGRRSGQRFDAEHGVVTEALLFLGELDPEAIGAAVDDATHYEPTPVKECRALLDALPAVNGWTFVDVGAGMGRVLMLASLRPFRQIVGVEVSGALCETARDNLVRWRRAHEHLACKDVRMVCADAAAYAFPRGDLVVYLYNPFGERTLSQLVNRLAARDGKCIIVYHTPIHRRILDQHANFELMSDLGFGTLYRLCIT
jgi:SAM-dependent methyltransferase